MEVPEDFHRLHPVIGMNPLAEISRKRWAGHVRKRQDPKENWFTSTLFMCLLAIYGCRSPETTIKKVYELRWVIPNHNCYQYLFKMPHWKRTYWMILKAMRSYLLWRWFGKTDCCPLLIDRRHWILVDLHPAAWNQIHVCVIHVHCSVQTRLALQWICILLKII